MAQMTVEQLTEHIKKVAGEYLPKDIKEVVEESVARSMEGVKAQQTDLMAQILGGRNGNEDKPKERQPGYVFARCVSAIARAKMDGFPTAERAMDVLRGWGDGDLAETWKEQKALSAGDPAAGGFLIPTQFSQDVIPLLRASAVVRSLDPLIVPVPTGSVRVPKITAGSTASYIGENVNIPKTEPAFGQLTLAFKKLAALVPLSNDLLRYSSPAADGIVRDDVVRAMASREDKAFIRDDGTDSTPKGLRNWIHTDNKFNANATVNIANTTNDLGEMIRLLMAANVPMIITQFPAGGSVPAVDVRPGWLMSPRTYKHLTTIRTTNGPFAFRDEMLRGTLWGFPFRVTSQILETMTAAFADTGGNQSELYFGGFAFAVIGESMNLVVDVSQEAAYHDGTAVQAAFSLDQTIVRVIAEHDFALRQDKGFALMRQVTWGV
ncbi:MAG: phage major capsid protein [Rhodospirillales bacterium]